MKKQQEKVECEERCNLHGTLSVRGRRFQGNVTKIVGQRAVVEWERTTYFPKYERFGKSKSKLHAHIPKCFLQDLKLGDYIEIGECRPLSKITHFVMVGKIKKWKQLVQ